MRVRVRVGVRVRVRVRVRARVRARARVRVRARPAEEAEEAVRGARMLGQQPRRVLLRQAGRRHTARHTPAQAQG